MYDVPRAHPKVTRLWLWWATTYLLAALISALVARLVVTWRCAGGCGAVQLHFEVFLIPADLRNARVLAFLAADLMLVLTATIVMRLMLGLLGRKPPWAALFKAAGYTLLLNGFLVASIGYMILGQGSTAHATLGPIIGGPVLLTLTLPFFVICGSLHSKVFGVEPANASHWSGRYTGAVACAWLIFVVAAALCGPEDITLAYVGWAVAWLIFVVAAALCGPEDITLAYVGWAVAWSLFGVVSGGLLMPLLAPRK